MAKIIGLLLEGRIQSKMLYFTFKS